MDQGVRITREKNPREKASIFSIILFCFTVPVLRKGRKHGLEENDIYQVLPKFDSENLGNTLESYWNRSRYSRNNNVKSKQNGEVTSNGYQKQSVEENEPRTIFRCLLRCFGCYYFALGVMQLIMKTIAIILLPKAMSKFVAFFQTDQTTVSKKEAVLYAFLLITINVVNCIYNHNYQQIVMEYSMKVRSALGSLIYRKALKLGSGAFSDASMGKVVTLITKDVYSIDTALQFFNDLWIGVIQTIVVTCVLYKRIGGSVFAGIGFFLLMVPLQVYCGKCFSQKRLVAAKNAEKRIQLVKETFTAIKIVKMYTWQEYFHKLITTARINETAKLRIIYYLKAVILTVGGLTHKLALFLTIITYTLAGHAVNAETVYFIQQCYNALRSCYTVSFPMGISSLAEVTAAMKRFQAFLTAPEFKERDSSSVSIVNPKVYLNKVSVQIDGKEVLNSVSINLEKGLLLVAGNIGSGKSTLLKTILNEYPISGGDISISGTISYAPEEPWLFPSTIRQNILFGQPYEQSRYEQVLRVCALTHDINMFKDLDSTIVGDSGVNLSKGQQARICLARAVYKNSDIYLLDDCLSALDAQVNKHVLNECIRGFLKDKLVILVNNNVNNIKSMPTGSVLYLENGRTLDLKQQNEALDKRITYYIDEDILSHNKSLMDPNNSNEQFDATESDQLLNDNTVDAKKNLYHEETKKGKVLWKNYVAYYRSSGGILVLILTIIVFFCCQAALSASEKLISIWVNKEPARIKMMINNKTETEEYAKLLSQTNRTVNWYIGVMLFGTALTLIRSIMNFYFCTRAGRKLHKVLIAGLLNARMVFFDHHYIGNIVNRISKDFHTIDESIPFIIYENFRSLFIVLGTVVLIVSVNKLFIILTAIMIITLYFIQRYYINTGRSLKRLEAATRSPMIGYVSASLEGLPVVRAFDQEGVLKHEFDRHQDLYISANYMNLSSIRMFAFTLDMVATFFVSAIVLIFAFWLNGASAGDVGLAVSQAMLLTGLLQWAIRQATEMESTMTSVERVLEYAEAEPEDKYGKYGHWPRNGNIRYESVSLTYQTTGEEALKDISFEVPAKSKIGIVGRTGAGKSSIISTLFRLYDFEGRILIDDVDIKELSLDLLRSKIGIIPQDPILFSGTIRTNIDPLNIYKDSEIWNALEKVQMRPVIMSLDQEIVDHGQSFSSGQRQLLCLARALLCKNKIIILDEATANMDLHTDKLIQSIIQESFAECTVLTIAHRLYSFTNSDKVLVVEDGQIVEFDDPKVLMLNENSVFCRMTKSAGVSNDF
ncbi:multidrug resistance-associated protein 4-like [Sitophilus oryzae]|uniref:Multidrug resistance-associated protein 4-like n=1 Tax=Sitophilus oryzae TaxID=7048 RepID=A0A6J2XI65_SITOR|nr:multidrug resistance-associated protein 4-like [Sitophilus oryzae]